MDDQLQFLKDATKAFKAEREAADTCHLHSQDCFICRGLKSRWKPYRWLIDVLFVCHTMKNLLFEHAVAKADADEYRSTLDADREPETPSLEWLDGLYALRDDRGE